MPFKLFLTALILKLKNFSASNALGFFFGLSGGAILYWLNSRQLINLLPIAQASMNFFCAIGIECIQQAATSTTTASSASTAVADTIQTNGLIVNAFIGIVSLVLSWLATELYEVFGKQNKKVQEWESKAEEIKNRITGKSENMTSTDSMESTSSPEQLKLFQDSSNQKGE